MMDDDVYVKAAIRALADAGRHDLADAVRKLQASYFYEMERRVKAERERAEAWSRRQGAW